MENAISDLIPIYNEIIALELCVLKVHDTLYPFDFEILIINYDSPDESGHLADRLGKRFSKIFLYNSIVKEIDEKMGD